MGRRSNGHNVRACPQCDVAIIDVIDTFTGASYPVEAEPIVGVTLDPAPPGKRNALASVGEVHIPHLPRCSQTELGQEEG